MNVYDETEVRAVRDVIEVVEARLRGLESSGQQIKAPRAQMYAVVIQAVMSSARAAGSFGAGSFANAPLLDAILDGVERTDWDATLLAALIYAHTTY